MYNNSPTYVNFTKFDNLVLILDEILEHIPEMKNRRSRAQASAHGRDILGKLYNLGHGINLDYLCDGGNVNKRSIVAKLVCKYHIEEQITPVTGYLKRPTVDGDMYAYYVISRKHRRSERL